MLRVSLPRTAKIAAAMAMLAFANPCAASPGLIGAVSFGFVSNLQEELEKLEAEDGLLPKMNRFTGEWLWEVAEVVTNEEYVTGAFVTTYAQTQQEVGTLLVPGYGIAQDVFGGFAMLAKARLLEKAGYSSSEARAEARAAFEYAKLGVILESVSLIGPKYKILAFVGDSAIAVHRADTPEEAYADVAKIVAHQMVSETFYSNAYATKRDDLGALRSEKMSESEYQNQLEKDRRADAKAARQSADSELVRQSIFDQVRRDQWDDIADLRREADDLAERISDAGDDIELLTIAIQEARDVTNDAESLRKIFDRNIDGYEAVLAQLADSRVSEACHSNVGCYGQDDVPEVESRIAEAINLSENYLEYIEGFGGLSDIYDSARDRLNYLNNLREYESLAAEHDLLSRAAANEAAALSAEIGAIDAKIADIEVDGLLYPGVDGYFPVETVSPVPLPATFPLLACALALLQSRRFKSGDT